MSISRAKGLMKTMLYFDTYSAVSYFILNKDRKKCACACLHVEAFTVKVSLGVLSHIVMSFPLVRVRVFKKTKITKSINIAAVMC